MNDTWWTVTFLNGDMMPVTAETSYEASFKARLDAWWVCGLWLEVETVNRV